MKLKILSSTLALFVLLFCTNLYAQKKASPPKVTTFQVGDNAVTINYSSPSKKGREIFNGLVAYGKIWRTGANEATTIEVTKDCKIGGLDLPTGKYSLFTIPSESEWTVIINKNPKQWGAYDYDQSKDVGRFKVTPTSLDETVEMLTILGSDSGVINIAWDKTQVSFSIK